ncbi:MAG: XRE family transcriptional regulator [Clostridia bacterium]|nr:XRE family transcriptional regulator [Clostridia bacterium]
MLSYNLKEVALRLKSLRDLMGVSEKEMAKATDTSVKEYNEYENGEKDFTFNFLYNCANVLGCNITELITGDSAKLSHFAVTRKGDGMPIIRNNGFNYIHLAYNMKERKAEPFVVTIPYAEELENKPIETSMHSGQEMDYVLEGIMRVSIDGHIVELHEGDTIYYNSEKPHGLIAVGGKPVKIIAIVMN